MRHRVAEIRAVTKILEQEHEDLDAMVIEILDAITEIKWGRNPWVTAIREPWSDPFYRAVGPYATRGEAERDIGKRVHAVSVGGAQYRIIQVCNMDAIEEAPEGLYEEEVELSE